MDGCIFSLCVCGGCLWMCMHSNVEFLTLEEEGDLSIYPCICVRFFCLFMCLFIVHLSILLSLSLSLFLSLSLSLSFYPSIYIYMCEDSISLTHRHRHTHTHTLSLSLSLSLYIYIYIHIYINVFVLGVDILKSQQSQTRNVEWNHSSKICGCVPLGCVGNLVQRGWFAAGNLLPLGTHDIELQNR